MRTPVVFFVQKSECGLIVVRDFGLSNNTSSSALDPLPLIISYQDRRRCLIQRNHATILVLIPPVTKSTVSPTHRRLRSSTRCSSATPLMLAFTPPALIEQDDI